MARDAAIDAIFGRERQRRLLGGDRLEQLLGGEVEPGELLGGEHADREARRGDGALHEHAVEFDLHHAAEALDDDDADDGGQHGRGDRGDLRRDPVGGRSSVTGGVSRKIATARPTPSTPAAMRISGEPRSGDDDQQGHAGGEGRGGVAADVVQVPDRDDVEGDRDQRGR